MSPRIFITGITGYIGGDVFFNVHKAHPDLVYAALVRSKDKADAITAKYPSIELIIGGLDDFDIIKDQATKADIVIHTADASDHEGAARAIAEGLVARHTKEHPGYWLHTGGTGILSWEDTKLNRLGEESDKIYDDWEGVTELTSLPDDAFHRNVDKIVLETGTKHSDSVKTALLCPPTIYGTTLADLEAQQLTITGKGRGPGNTRSRQAYELAKVILTDKYVPIIGKGRARWNQVHVADLADVFLLLVDAAFKKNNNAELWGEKGYFLVENGEFVWSDLAKQMGAKAAEMGFIPPPKAKALSKEAAMKQAGFEAVSWGLNSRARAKRARNLLGWKPQQPSIEEEIPAILESEHRVLNN